MISKLTYCQLTNLIPNGSFELNTPVYDPLCDTFFYIENIPNWERGNSNSRQYFSELNNYCSYPVLPYPFDSLKNFGVPYNDDCYEFAKDGIAYMGIGIYSDSILFGDTRSLTRVKLDSSLKSNHVYCLSFWVSNCDCSDLTSDAIGALFTDTAFYSFVLETIPTQIRNKEFRFISSNGWTLISGIFTANGTENYLTIGNFSPLDSTNTTTQLVSSKCYTSYPLQSWFIIDDVALYDCTGFYYEADAGQNAELCKGEEITLGWDENTNRSFKWSVISGDSASLINDSIPRPTVSPQETTVYALYVIDEYVQEHYDTVKVEVIDCENPIFVPNIFSPNGDGQNDVLYVRSTYIQELKDFRVFNRWGEEIFQCRTSTGLSMTLEDCGWDGTFHGENAPQAVYVYYVEAVLLNGETVIKRGNVTLVR